MKIDRVIRRLGPVKRLAEIIVGSFLKNNISEIRRYLKTSQMVVVCNGPSLNKIDLEDLSQFDTIGLNKIDLIYSKTKWRPSILVVTSGIVIKQHLSVLNSTSIPVVLPVKAFFLGVRPRKNVFFCRPTMLNSLSDQLGRMYYGSTVTASALQLAMNLGYEKIGIVGMDHSFRQTGENNEITKFEGDDDNHFHPDYFKGQIWGNPDLIGSEGDYRALRDFAEVRGISIVDYTVGGHCQIFDKGDYQSLVGLGN